MRVRTPGFKEWGDPAARELPISQVYSWWDRRYLSIIYNCSMFHPWPIFWIDTQSIPALFDLAKHSGRLELRMSSKPSNVAFIQLIILIFFWNHTHQKKCSHYFCGRCIWYIRLQFLLYLLVVNLINDIWPQLFKSGGRFDLFYSISRWRMIISKVHFYKSIYIWELLWD